LVGGVTGNGTYRTDSILAEITAGRLASAALASALAGQWAHAASLLAAAAADGDAERAVLAVAAASLRRAGFMITETAGRMRHLSFRKEVRCFGVVETKGRIRHRNFRELGFGAPTGA